MDILVSTQRKFTLVRALYRIFQVRLVQLTIVRRGRRSRGYGFVNFDNPAHADELVRRKGESWVYGNKKVEVHISHEGDRQHVKDDNDVKDRGNPSPFVVLRSLPPSADLETVKEVFTEFEGVKFVRLCASCFSLFLFFL